MVLPEDRPRFLVAEPVRLEIAGLCSTEALSRGEIAKRLRRLSGSISSADTMLRSGALLRAGFAASSGKRRGAELLRLNPEWAGSLQEATRLLRPAVLEPGTDLLLIPLGATLEVCEMLAKGTDDIGWGAELSGEQMGLLLSTEQANGGGATIRATAALDRAGVRPIRVRLGAPMAPDELRRWASEVIDGETRALEPGGREDPE
jgi:hypothetical protein